MEILSINVELNIRFLPEFLIIEVFNSDAYTILIIKMESSQK